MRGQRQSGSRFRHSLGDIWNFAVRDPRTIVGWVVVEERAEGGDVLYATAKRNPMLLEGFTRVAEGGGVALYRRR